MLFLFNVQLRNKYDDDEEDMHCMLTRDKIQNENSAQRDANTARWP